MCQPPRCRCPYRHSREEIPRAVRTGTAAKPSLFGGGSWTRAVGQRKARRSSRTRGGSLEQLTAGRKAGSRLRRSPFDAHRVDLEGGCSRTAGLCSRDPSARRFGAPRGREGRRARRTCQDGRRADSSRRRDASLPGTRLRGSASEAHRQERRVLGLFALPGLSRDCERRTHNCSDAGRVSERVFERDAQIGLVRASVGTAPKANESQRDTRIAGSRGGGGEESTGVRHPTAGKSLHDAGGGTLCRLQERGGDPQGAA